MRFLLDVFYGVFDLGLCDCPSDAICFLFMIGSLILRVQICCIIFYCDDSLWLRLSLSYRQTDLRVWCWSHRIALQSIIFINEWKQIKLYNCVYIGKVFKRAFLLIILYPNFSKIKYEIIIIKERWVALIRKQQLFRFMALHEVRCRRPFKNNKKGMYRLYSILYSLHLRII